MLLLNAEGEEAGLLEAADFLEGNCSFLSGAVREAAAAKSGGPICYYWLLVGNCLPRLIYLSECSLPVCLLFDMTTAFAQPDRDHNQKSEL